MKASASMLALTLILGVALSCQLSEKLAGDDNSVMVNELWPDVTPFPGATKKDLKLPLVARIITRAFANGKASFIAFSADKPVQEVKDFYSGDAMKTGGWTTVDDSCFSDTDEMRSGGKVCTFTKTGQKEEMLAIMVQDDSAGTVIFYIRMDMTHQNR